jgi:hypothetical protein
VSERGDAKMTIDTMVVLFFVLASLAVYHFVKDGILGEHDDDAD